MQIRRKRVLIWTVICIFFTGSLPAQEQDPETVAQAHQKLSERGEVIIRFVRPPGTGLEYLTAILSIDNYRNDTIVAYANASGFDLFLKLGIPFEVMKPPSLQPERWKVSAEKAGDWRRSYPGYAEYVDLMEQFSADHPDLCRLVQFGTSVNGHRLLALRISDNPGIYEKEPVVLYTSTMHGDEITGYMLMLRLIEELVTLYASDAQIKRLVDSVDIWINPLANPDGAYFLSDLSVNGATRLNANSIDLNRDFPNPDDPHWEGRTRQPETRAMMDLMADLRPALAANFHGGAEVVNYPWDTWERLHADNDWYWNISRSYADTVHLYATPGYMNDLDNGITNGYMWYTVYGGRQDYTNYFLHGREVTIELSTDKMPPDSSLEDYWNFNRNGLLHFITRALSGITGDVTDSVTGMPVEAFISIENHDADNSEVISSAESGRFYRLTGSGHFALEVSAAGYRTKHLGVPVTDGILSHRNIRLLELLPLVLYPNPFSEVLSVDIVEPGENLEIELFDLAGRKVKHITIPVASSGTQVIRINGLASGLYVVNISYGIQFSRQVMIRMSE